MKKASLIIPCWNSAATLDRCIACVRVQTCEDFEAIFVDDGSDDATGSILAAAADGDVRIRVVTQKNRGVSAARNAALDIARGELIFFADPDDVFSPQMIEKGIAAMEDGDADYCVFPYRERFVGESDFHSVPLKGTCRYATNDEVVSQHMSRMFGYSVQQVRDWHRGVAIDAHRLQGAVWRCVYRRAIIEAHHIRFDERIYLYEDAMFNCEYMLYVERMTCVDEMLYDYIHYENGAIARLRRGMKELENKFELLRKRKELDRKSGGRLWPMYTCSCVFSLLEMVQIVVTRRAPFWRGLRMVRDYLRDDVLRVALREFPISIHRPVVALAVCFFTILQSLICKNNQQ